MSTPYQRAERKAKDEIVSLGWQLAEQKLPKGSLKAAGWPNSTTMNTSWRWHWADVLDEIKRMKR